VLAKAKAEEAIKGKSVKYTRDTPDTLHKPVIPNLGPISKENSDMLHLSQRKVYEKPVEFGGRYCVVSFIEEKQPDQAQWEKEKEGTDRALPPKERRVPQRLQGRSEKTGQG
jgi:hypothetical protein